MNKYVCVLILSAATIFSVVAMYRSGVNKPQTLDEVAAHVEKMKAEAEKKAFEDKYRSKEIGPYLYRYIDPETGCHYLKTSHSGSSLTPRMKPNGEQWCD